MKKNKSNNIYSNIYIFLVCAFSFLSILSSTYIDDIFTAYGEIYLLFQNMCLLVFSFFAIINTKLSQKKFIIVYIIFLLIFFILLKNSDKSLLVLIMMMFAIPKNIKLSKLSQSIIFTNFFTIVMIIILCKLGFITDYKFMQRNVIRHGMGFVSANALSNLVTATIVMYIFHKKEKLSIFNIIICSFVLLFSAYLTNSRSAMFLRIHFNNTFNYFKEN